MSNQYLYRCEKCNHTLYTDHDGCECTWNGIAFLYHCPDCGVLAKLWENCREGILKWSFPHKLDIDSQPIVGMDTLYGSSRDYSGTCPICGSANIHRWNPNDNYCPKCGGKMYRDFSVGPIHTD